MSVDDHHRQWCDNAADRIIDALNVYISGAITRWHLNSAFERTKSEQYQREILKSAILVILDPIPPEDVS